MKKLLALLLVVTTLFAFVACNQNESVVKGTVTVVEYVEGGTDKEYVVDLSKANEPQSVFDVLKYLNEEKNVTLTYTESPTMGAYVTAFGDLREKSNEGLYISFWTSVEEDWDVSVFASEKTYKGTKLVSSIAGFSSAKLEDGAIFYIGTIEYK